MIASSRLNPDLAHRLAVVRASDGKGFPYGVTHPAKDLLS
jgi:hypothetical protein